jgi:hypothetical protein
MMRESHEEKVTHHIWYRRINTLVRSRNSHSVCPGPRPRPALGVSARANEWCRAPGVPCAVRRKVRPGVRSPRCYCISDLIGD